MDESLKSLRWSILVMNAGCLSILAAMLSFSGERETVTVMSFTVPVSLLLIGGYAVVLLLQGQTHLHLTHIARLAASGVGRDALLASPVVSMHAAHDDTSLDSFLREALLFIQLLFLPTFTGASVAALALGVVVLGLVHGLTGALYLVPLAMLAVTSLSAWRSHRLFRSLCKQIYITPAEHGPEQQG